MKKKINKLNVMKITVSNLSNTAKMNVLKAGYGATSARNTECDYSCGGGCQGESYFI